MTNLSAEIADKLRALQRHFTDQLPERLAEIEAQWHAGTDHAVLHRLIHSLAGAAGTFGFHGLGKQARELEHLVEQLAVENQPSPVEADVEQALQRLRALAQQGPDRPDQHLSTSATPSSSDDQPHAPLVYILERDARLAADLVRQLQHFRYRAEVFDAITALTEAVAQRSPDALVADIRPAIPFSEPGIRDIRNLPIIFVSDSDTWEDRLQAVRAGGQAFLSKPVNFAYLVEQLDELTGHKAPVPYRILVVEDTPLLAQHYAAVLEAAGMLTEVVTEAPRLLEALASFKPDLILMDVYMPGCSGIEAAQVVRQHAEHSNLPVVYLSTETGRQQQLDALRVGDDFLEKPISDHHLVSAVRIRARRFRELRALITRDSLTGLFNHINLKLALEREMAQSRRRGSSLCFAMIDIDRFKTINDTHGHPVGDRVIKSLARLIAQRLRKSDVAARYGGEEFALILPDTGRDNAWHVIDDLRRQFSEITHFSPYGEFNATFSAGLACCPPHDDMEALIAAADGALYRAKHGGRNAVVAAGG